MAARDELLSAADPLAIAQASTLLLPEAITRLHQRRGVVARDRSALSESFRMLRHQVLQRLRAEGHQLLAITSARAIEGKSLTAVNLALTIAADYDSTVLLVDADLTGKGLQTLFGLADREGLSDHLTQGTALAELLVNPGMERLLLLPAGKEAGLNSAELLVTHSARQLFLELRQRYENRYVIVDLPPLLEKADAVAFLPQAQATLVVVEEHTTSLADIEKMTELLAPFNLIGSVMSQAPERERARRPAAKKVATPWYGDAIPSLEDELVVPVAERAPWHRRWFRRKG